MFHVIMATTARAVLTTTTLMRMAITETLDTDIHFMVMKQTERERKFTSSETQYNLILL